MSGKFPDSPEKISAYESCKNMSRDESNLRSLSVRRKNKLRAFDTNVTKKFTHFVRKVFARKILPTGKLGLFRPLHLNNVKKTALLEKVSFPKRKSQMQM